MEIFSEYLIKIGNQFVDPKKRVFIAYILISLAIALGWFIFKRKLSFKKALNKIFDKKIFFSKSAKSDYKIFLIAFLNDSFLFRTNHPKAINTEIAI